MNSPAPFLPALVQCRPMLCTLALACWTGCATRSAETSAVPLAPSTTSSAAPPQPATAARQSPPETEPAYWLDQLSAAASRERAIPRLAQFFEDAKVRANGDLDDPAVRALIDLMVVPLRTAYVEYYGELEPKSREELLRLFEAFRDVRTAPALEATFLKFAESGADGSGLKWAARAARDLKLKALAPSLFKAFKRLRLETKEGASSYRDMNEALLAVAERGWTPELLALVEVGFPRADSAHPDTIAAYRNGFFRTLTAVQLLGILRDPAAVRPLIKLLLDPQRTDAADEALLSLVKIGRPVVADAAALLAGDAELLAFQKQRFEAAGVREQSLHVMLAARILGAVGCQEGITPVLTALASAKRDAERVPLLLALSQLPHTDAVKSAFAKGLAGLRADATYQGRNALAMLAETAVSFCDPALTDVLVRRGRELRHNEVAMMTVAQAALSTTDGARLASVQALLGTIPRPREEGSNSALLQTLERERRTSMQLLELCAEDPACYLEHATTPSYASDSDQSTAQKALYRFGQLAGPEGASAIVAALPSLQEGRLRYVACRVLDHQLPQGSTKVADDLAAIVEVNKRSMDASKQAADRPLRDIIDRLRARAALP